jgi:hypothetical protein
MDHLDRLFWGDLFSMHLFVDATELFEALG